MDEIVISIIVPTLNEEKCIEHLLKSLETQTFPDFEVILVDGGSKDQTLQKADKYKFNTKTVTLDGAGEFYSRDFGASLAQGPILLFTCADVIFPQDLLERVYKKFEEDEELIALGGPHIPYNGPLVGKIEYTAFNIFRYLTAKLRYAFHCGTNFFAVRKHFFDKVGGFGIEAIDADGIPATKIADYFGFSKAKFSFDTQVFISTRRIEKMGFLGFNKHYFSYCWGMFLPHPIRWHPKISSLIQRTSEKLRKRHLELHRATNV